MTKEEAIQLYDSKFYEAMSDHDRVKFQIFEEKLCMPFSVFHRSVERVLGRPVWTHEFASIDRLKKEFLKEKPMPSIKEIMELIPKDKRVAIVA